MRLPRARLADGYAGTLRALLVRVAGTGLRGFGLALGGGAELEPGVALELGVGLGVVVLACALVPEKTVRAMRSATAAPIAPALAPER